MNEYISFNYNHKRKKVYLKPIRYISGDLAKYTLYCCCTNGYHYENFNSLQALKKKYKQYLINNNYGFGLIPCYVIV